MAKRPIQNEAVYLTVRKRSDPLRDGTLESSGRPLGWWAVGAITVIALGYTVAPKLFPSTYDVSGVTVASTSTASTTPLVPIREQPAALPSVAYLKTPEPLKAIYMSQCVVGTPGFRAELVQLIDETEINAVVIDIKDFTGKLSFTPQNPALAASVSDECGATDMPAFLKMLKGKGIYTIGRITVFQDPYYTKTHPELAVKTSDTQTVWRDNKGLNFIEVGAKPFWDYIISISKDAHLAGFDELNYDYIRFPSDGPMSDIYFPFSNTKPKAVALEEFFKYLSAKVKDPQQYPEGIPVPVISADLFGMTTTNKTDMNIGQVLEAALPYFDYIAPMVYPSHYPAGFNGWDNPNHYPYQLIKYVMEEGRRRTEATETIFKTIDGQPVYKEVVVPATATEATTTKKVATGMYTKETYSKLKLRPWLQDFDYGGEYGPEEVRAQIQATYDAGLTSWMLWAPSNRYTREALQ